MKMRYLAMLLTAVLLQACVHSGDTRFNVDLSEAARINTQLGMRYLQQGNTEQALIKLQKALSQDDDIADTHWGLALVHAQFGEAEKASSYFKQARKLAPNNSDILASYGSFLCEQGKLQEAQETFQAALAIPRYLTPEVAYTNAGSCFLRHAENAQAEDNFRRALNFNSGYPRALLQLAQLSYEAQDYLRSRAFLQRLQAQNVESLESLLLGLRTEYALGDRQAVQAYAKKMRAIAPDIGNRIDLNTGKAW